LLLRKRNKLYRLGHIAADDQLAIKSIKSIKLYQKTANDSFVVLTVLIMPNSGLCYVVPTTGEPKLSDFIIVVMSMTLTSILHR